MNQLFYKFKNYYIIFLLIDKICMYCILNFFKNKLVLKYFRSARQCASCRCLDTYTTGSTVRY